MRPRIASLLIVFLASTASAEEAYRPPEFLAATPPLPAGLENQNPLRIDLAEALRLAVKHNLDVVLERHGVEVARQGIYVARGEFEPTVTAGYSHGNFTRPPVSIQEGAPDAVITATDHSWRLGIQQRFSTGTRVDVQFDNSRARSSGGTAVQPINFGATLSAT